MLICHAFLVHNIYPKQCCNEAILLVEVFSIISLDWLPKIYVLVNKLFKLFNIWYTKTLPFFTKKIVRNFCGAKFTHISFFQPKTLAHLILCILFLTNNIVQLSIIRISGHWFAVLFILYHYWIDRWRYGKDRLWYQNPPFKIARSM